RGGHYGAGGEPRDSADAVTRGTTATEPRAETDQQTGRDDDSPACRHLRRWHGIPDPAGGERCQNESCNKSATPRFVAYSEAEAASKYAADAGDSAGQKHQQCRRNADQRTAD